MTPVESQMLDLRREVLNLHGDFVGQSKRIDRLEVRLDRIERRLEIVPA
jgi:hypothetical protein